MKTTEVNRPYKKNNIFTFGHSGQKNERNSQLLQSVGDPDGYKKFDLGIIEIGDEGEFEYPYQLEAISNRIRKVRNENPNGAIVVCFIHGWHNNADWDNGNLISFRKLLRSLMYRELEFLNRRVIGVYLGWNGKPVAGIGRWISNIPLLNFSSFRDRYSTAGDIGQGDALSHSLIQLTLACKDVLDNSKPEAPLIMVGHSMGAYILQSATRELIKNPAALQRPVDSKRVTQVTISNDPSLEVKMPDLILSLNSAAEAEVAKEIIRTISMDKWKKTFDPSKTGIKVKAYNPPLLISTTSTKDYATNWVWELGHFKKKTTTDGHNPKLATHTFVKSDEIVNCVKAGGLDFGQPWHCLHKDNKAVVTPRFRINLPDNIPQKGKTLTHTGYNLIPNKPKEASAFWLFQTPEEIIPSHSDIFNFKAASFVLALIQASAVLASAGSRGWASNFSEISLSD